MIATALAHATPSAAATDVLPAITNPHPFRQSIFVTCNDQSHPNLGSNLCVMAIDTVPAKHLLELSTVNCLGGGAGTGTFLFKNQLKLQAPYFLALFDNSPSTTVSFYSGQFYLAAGEHGVLVRSGSSSSALGICAVNGTLWQTP